VGIGFLLSFLIFRKKTLDYILFILTTIENRVLEFHDIPENEYNNTTKELKRAINAVLGQLKWNLWTPIIKKATRFICLVLETDNAYRFRLQDAVSEAYERKERNIFSVFRVLMERETRAGINRKWKLLLPVVKVMLFLSPTLKEFEKRFFDELNAEKIKMDEDDWYFTLRYKSYNFKGLTDTERLFELKQLDFIKGHVYLY
jgi:hypothetical protein